MRKYCGEPLAFHSCKKMVVWYSHHLCSCENENCDSEMMMTIVFHFEIAISFLQTLCSPIPNIFSPNEYTHSQGLFIIRCFLSM